MPPRLGILVPYRDRAAHLAEFLAELPRYLAADPVARDIPARILVVEQAPGLPFNRGFLLNIGFALLANEVDYLCLHDVDQVPLRADYTQPNWPTMIISEGLGLDPAVIPALLSCVVLVRREHFLAANGFSLSYWGWGYEDVDLRERLLRRGLPPAHREGIFRPLPHPHHGIASDGGPSAAKRRNQALYLARWAEQTEAGWRRKAPPPEDWALDGLAGMRFGLLQPRRPLEAGGMTAEHVVAALPPAPDGGTNGENAGGGT